MYKKCIWLLLAVLIAGCGTNPSPPASVEQDAFTFEIEENEFSLTADIHISDEVKVEASLINIGEETLVFNGRCGIPFGISVKMEGAHAHLVAPDEESVECEDIFDPKDLREMKPDESFDKSVTFERKLRLSNEETVAALSGTYKVQFFFQVHDDENFSTTFPIELAIDLEPEILTLDQAKDSARESESVKEWFREWEGKNAPIEEANAILSDGMWTVAFHAVHDHGADRLIVNMDARSGEVEAVNTQKMSPDVLESFND